MLLLLLLLLSVVIIAKVVTALHDVLLSLLRQWALCAPNMHCTQCSDCDVGCSCWQYWFLAAAVGSHALTRPSGLTQNLFQRQY
jgi:hypothetical protein